MVVVVKLVIQNIYEHSFLIDAFASPHFTGLSSVVSDVRLFQNNEC